MPPDESAPEENRFERVQGAVFGTGNNQFNLFTGGNQLLWPHRVGVVPPLAVCRQPRAVDMKLFTGTQASVIVGFGGVGKTQVAAAYAHRVWADRSVDLLVWINATSAPEIADTLKQAAADVTGEREATAERFLAWLAATERRWLIIFDDVQDPGDLRGLWPPATPSGHTVATTRRRDSALLAGRTVLEVDLFTEAESLNYLREKLPGQVFIPEDALGLSADLGHLPLALAQATAYIDDLGLTCAAYRRRFNDQRRLSKVFPESHSLPDEQRATVTATWSLSMQAVNSLEPVGLALPLLRLFAVADVNLIQFQMFRFRPVVDHLSAQWPSGKTVSVDDARDSLGNLRRFNLITMDDDDNVRVHPLLRRVVRENTSDSNLRELDGVVTQWLNEMIIDMKRGHLSRNVNGLGIKMDAAIERAGMRAGTWLGTRLRRLIKGPDE